MIYDDHDPTTCPECIEDNKIKDATATVDEQYVANVPPEVMEVLNLKPGDSISWQIESDGTVRMLKKEIL